MRYFSGCLPTTSSVLTPMDPVEPRMVRLFNYPHYTVTRNPSLGVLCVQFRRRAFQDRTNRRDVSYCYLIDREPNPLTVDQVSYA
jgi:hypothetical protein